jgi:hypothetical protein
MKSGPRRVVSTATGHHVDLLPFPTEADAFAGSVSISDAQDKHSTFTPYIGSSEVATVR